MLDSFLAPAALVVVGLIVLAVVNPVIGIVIVAVAFVPLALMLGGSLFRKTSPTVATDAPSVPSTAEASYDPVSDPTARN